MIDIDKLEALAKAAASRGQEDCESLNDWLSAEEFMSNMLLHPVDARFAEACTPGAVLALIAEVRTLRKDKDRLDTGCIMTYERDEFGESYKCERRGNDLRKMIDEAMAAHPKEPPCSAG